MPDANTIMSVTITLLLILTNNGLHNKSF